MKKTLSIFALALCATYIHAQGISKDFWQFGQRNIVGESFVARNTKDKVVFNYALTCVVDSQKVASFDLCVMPTSWNPYSVHKGAYLKIETLDGKELELHSSYDVEAIVRDVHNVNGFVYSDYSKSIGYPITKDQIEHLRAGVKNVTLEILGDEPFCVTYKKDKVSEKLMQEYDEMQKRIEKQ